MPPRKKPAPRKTGRIEHVLVDGVEHKICTTCRRDGRPYVHPLSAFSQSGDRHDGLRPLCKECEARAQKRRYDNDGTGTRERQTKRVTERQRRNQAASDARSAEVVDRAQRRAEELLAEREHRIGSDFDQLRPDDFDDLSVGNDPRDASSGERARAGKDKRAEYSRNMGRFRGNLEVAAHVSKSRGGAIADHLPKEDGAYIAGIAEQQRRFTNRRVARSISLFAAAELDAMQQSIAAMQKYMAGRIRPAGYAEKHAKKVVKRTVCCLLSDLHLGSDLSAFDEPQAFGMVEEARRLEQVLRQFVDYKPQYREHSDALLILNGDMIEGQLMHDLRSGAPLVEQKMVFQSLLGDFVGHVAARFPQVRVVCQPGNHGRDKVRHPGRATARKFDGHETECYHGLRAQCRDLKNVKWQIDFRAVSIVDVHGAKLGVTHGDTEVRLGHPDKSAAPNAAAFEALNSNRTHGVEFDGWVVGHFHTPRFHPRRPKVLYNGALVPPNGYARSMGYVGEPTGQWIWESVPGHLFGDLRFIEVGVAHDRDTKLGKLIRPFRFELDG